MKDLAKAAVVSFLVSMAFWFATNHKPDGPGELGSVNPIYVLTASAPKQPGNLWENIKITGRAADKSLISAEVYSDGLRIPEVGKSINLEKRGLLRLYYLKGSQ